MRKAPTAQHMIKEIVKNRVNRAEQILLLSKVAEEIKLAITATRALPMPTPSFGTGTFLLLSKYIKDDARNSNLESVRRELIEALTEMTKEAEKERLDLRPYSGAPACSLFLIFCISKDPEAFNNAKKVADMGSMTWSTEDVFMTWVCDVVGVDCDALLEHEVTVFLNRP